MRAIALVLAVLAAQLAAAAPGDVPGARDPDLLGQRFQDAVIFHYEQHPFDSYEVPTGSAISEKNWPPAVLSRA